MPLGLNGRYRLTSRVGFDPSMSSTTTCLFFIPVRFVSCILQIYLKCNNCYSSNHDNHCYRTFLNIFSDQSSPGSSHPPSSTATLKTLCDNSDQGTMMKNCAEAQCMNWATVTETGARITVPRSSVSLTIPQGAVKPGATCDLYVAVLQPDFYRPRLDESQTAMTPVVR